MQFYGYHGLFPEENKLGQRFNVDLELYTDLRKAGQSDEMTDSIHYGEAFEIVRDIVEGEAKDLIEAVAETIAEALLKHFDLLQACKVTVIKPDAPIPGQFDNVQIEIYREQANE